QSFPSEIFRSVTDLSSTLMNSGASTVRATFFGSSAFSYRIKLASTVAPTRTVPSGNRSGPCRPTQVGPATGDFFLGGGGALSMMDTANVAGATLPSFQAGNDTVTFALPLPALAGTRTGP